MFTKAFQSPQETKAEMPMEAKSADYYNVQFQELFCGMGTLSRLGLDGLTAQVAWNYYKSVDPIFDAVDYLATEGAEIKLTIYDTEEDIHISEYDPAIKATWLLQKLKKPNRSQTGSEFMYGLIASYTVTGDAFVVANGLNPNEPPAEIVHRGTQYVTITGNSRDGLPDTYQINETYYNQKFKREISEYRFFNADKTQEIKQLTQQFNPNSGNGCFFGMSRLNPLYYRMEQQIQGNLHNNKLLKNGARPSGALIMKGLNDDAKLAIRDQVKKFYQGAGNAGNVMALSVGMSNYEDVEFREMSINNKDMDFAELQKMAEKAIYKIFKIPASFYDNSKSTFNNVTNDTYKMYDFAILPMMKRIVKSLNDFLMPRYDKSGRYVLSFSQREIPALEMRYIEVATTKIGTGLMTIPEGRNSLALPEWDEQEPLYNPKQGIKEEPPEEESPEEDTKQPEKDEEEEDKEKAYHAFYTVCKANKLTDEEIKEFAIAEGLL